MRRKGFTLIEVVLSMAIIGIIAISTLNMLSTGLVNIKRAGYRTTAVESVESIIINETAATTEALTLNNVEIYPLTSDENSDSIAVLSFDISRITGSFIIEGMNGSLVELDLYKNTMR